MNKQLFFSILTFGAIALFANSSSVEARHYHSRSNIQVGINTIDPKPQHYVVNNRYVPQVPAPMVVQPVQYYYGPNYYGQPRYVAYPAPVYVEQVYVTPSVYPRTNSGFSFSWNFFR